MACAAVVFVQFFRGRAGINGASAAGAALADDPYALHHLGIGPIARGVRDRARMALRARDDAADDAAAPALRRRPP